MAMAGLQSQSSSWTRLGRHANGKLIAKPVVLGLTDGTNYEVLADLSLGETIIFGVAEPQS